MSEILKHVARPWPARPAGFVDVENGSFLHEDGTAFAPGSLSLARLLHGCLAPMWGERRPRILYIVGGWVPYAETMPSPSWFEAPAGWTRVSYHRDPLLATYHHEGGARVTIYATAPWFGACADIELCRLAYVELRKALRGEFDAGVNLMGTPARTGLDLLERSLPCDKDGKPYEYPVLAGDVRELIEHNVGQGRMEWFVDAGIHGQAADIHGVDATWMYAACLTRVPVGPLHRDTVAELADGGYRPGFYRVAFQVPANWHHIGLLPMWSGERGAWWPRLADGVWYESFVNGELLRLAHECGWLLRIQERWLFAPEGTPGADPLRTWAKKLRDLRAGCTPEKYGALAGLLRPAYRSLLINPIGAFHRGGRYELAMSPASELPEEARFHLADEPAPAGLVAWWKPIPLDSSTAHFSRPEWAAMVWLRAMARLNRAALRLPFDAILALRTDEILTTAPVDWPDDGKPGTFRRKAAPLALAGRPMPRNEREYQRLRRELAREVSHA